jgi:hypothetical protein
VGIILKPGNLKIALCFSGQPRTWRKCIESWKQHVIQNNNVDIFCHLWDYNSIPNSIADGPADTWLSPEGDLAELIGILNPKKYIIEPAKTFVPIRKNQPIVFSNFLSQYYGIMSSARIKREYEIENMIQYDIVIRMRYDAFFTAPVIYNQHPSVIEDNSMYCFHVGWDHLTNSGRLGDIFWYSDSQTYDILADYYLNIHTIKLKYSFNKKPDMHQLFFHYAKKNNIKLIVNHWDIKLFRESAELAFSKGKDGFEIW